MADGDGVVAVRVRIEGRVQGVWYRGWAEGRARALGLSGWVRNRRDGSVEAVFEGPAEVVRSMVADCHDGPPAARVTRVVDEPYPDPVPPGFRTLPTA
jgi:acylphosphatase